MDGWAFVDRPRSGAVNMAIDLAMAELADRNKCVLLRLYQWSEPTMTLGYFQSIQQRTMHVPSRSLTCVRRLTGGGAIIHHHDWTYALAVPEPANQIGPATHLYTTVHTILAKWLKSFGLDADLWSTESPSLLATAFELPKSVAVSPNAFLCFDRRNSGDIVIDGSKILGSAQRRIGGVVLQHGSLLLATSPFAPSLAGLKELATVGSLHFANSNQDFSSFGIKILETLVADFGNSGPIEFQPSRTLADLPEDFQTCLQHAAPGRFAESAWYARR